MGYKIDNYELDTPISNIMEDLRTYLKGVYLNKMKRTGTDFMVSCPFHSYGKENKPSCGICIDESSEYYGVYHCFTCGSSGKLESLVGKVLNGDKEVGKDYLKVHYGKMITPEEDFLPEIILDSNKKSVNYLDESILEAFKYFHPYQFKRGLTEDIIRKFDVGYNEATNSITFPVRDIKGNLVGITQRNVLTKQFYIPENMEKCVYLLYNCVKENCNTIIVCEAQLDALKCWVNGYPAVAMLGAGTTKYQMDLINKSGIGHFILLYDNDSAGRKGANRFKSMVRDDVLVDDIIPPLGKDASDLSKKELDLLLTKAFK